MHCHHFSSLKLAAFSDSEARCTSQSWTRVLPVTLAALLSLSACGTADKVTENELPIESPATGSIAVTSSADDRPSANAQPTSQPTDEPDDLLGDDLLEETAALKSVHISDFISPDAQNQDFGPEPINITLTTWRAERGHTESQVALGQAYASGTPRVEKDMAQAKLWFEMASLNGDKLAQYELGKLFYTGQGAAQDYFNAHEWWIESALQGNLDAQQRLGYLYSEGLGVERDFEKAKLWYSKAAQQGHAEAQTLLGSLYHEGNRIPRDYGEAFKWYKLAAEQGHPHAQYTLATLYHDGLGTQVDYIQCAAWVDVAVANGFYDEYRARANCREKLDDLSNRTATHLADAWKQRYVATGI